MDQSNFIDALGSLRQGSHGGLPLPHKPLLLLLALGRARARKPRLATFEEMRKPLSLLLTDFSPSQANHPEYPFWRLSNDGGLWELLNAEGLRSRESNTDPPVSELLRARVAGGLPQDVFQELQSDPQFLDQAVGAVLKQYFDAQLHPRLRQLTGLTRDFNLVRNNEYSWDELGVAFEFKPNYLSSAGGMVSRPRHGVVLLITHPDGGRSFDYHDYWEGPDLIYTGRGLTGDQKLDGQNLDTAENRKQLLVFEGAGVRTLRYLGTAQCKEWWWGEGPDRDGNLREILRFRLSFSEETSPVSQAVGRAKFFGGGESQAHKDLKNFVARNPSAIGLPNDSLPDVEHSFLSPDRADVTFTLPNNTNAVVEIELRGERNTLVGAWQAIKYRTLMALETGLSLDDRTIRAFLVAYEMPDSTRAFCHRYSVEPVAISAAAVKTEPPS